MRDINELIKELIPPNDYQHRNGFSNEQIVLGLDDDEKREIETRLIGILETEADELVGETLVILKSELSLPTLNKRLELAKRPESKIVWASYINELDGSNDKMKGLVLVEATKVKSEFSLIAMFHYLARFNDPEITEVIKGFIDDKRYLVAYNARTSCGLDTKDLIVREQLKRKTNWWKFWK